MAVPTFLAGALNTDFRYKSTAVVVDVNTIISDLSGELVALGWTDASGVGTGPWTSPAHASGAFIVITATRISATRIAWIVKDHRGLLVNNDTDTRQDIEAVGSEVRYYANKFGCWVDSARVTPECWGCGIIDNSPETFGVPRSSYMASKGPRRNSDGSLINQALNAFYYLEVDGTSYISANSAFGQRNPAIATTVHSTFTGALLFCPFDVQYGVTALGFLQGRLFQTLTVDSTAGTFGAEFTVPIDTGVTGVFKVIGLTTISTWRVCARKS